jgi:hypothetical protein
LAFNTNNSPITRAKEKAIEIGKRIEKMFNPFEKGMDFVFEKEGRFVHDKDDPGGATNYGVTLGALIDAGIDIDGDGDIDVDDIKKLTPEVAMHIYKNKYWDGIDASDLDWPLAIAAFDTAVNCGVSRTKRWLQQTMDRGEDHLYLLNLRNIHYLTIIQKNPVLAKYKKGWMNRVNDLKKLIDILKEEA